jgi:integrase
MTPEKLTADEQEPVERRLNERRQRDEPVTAERRRHPRRKSYEIPLEEALRRLPKAEQTAMLVNDLRGVPADLAAITKPHERFRTQKGELITYTDGIYLRYYVANKHGKRVKVAEPLCPLGTSDRDAEKLRRKRMAAVNLEQRSQFFTPVAEGLTVAVFWEALYYPLIKENKSFSTALTYKRIWDAYLEPHFRTRSLERYSTEQAFEFMESLATRKTTKGKGLGRNSLSLCRAICYGIFKRAKSKGLLGKDAAGESRKNPWDDLASPDVKIRIPEKLVTYTMAEVAKVVQELPRTDAKLLFSFCSLLGMRPSEAAAVKWEDITPDEIHISRSAPRGHEQSVMKSVRSERTFALIRPIAWLVSEYQRELIEAAHGHKPSGYLFKRRDGSVINVSDFSQYHIGRHGMKAIGNRWAGLYAGRRAVGTGAYNLTGDTRAAFQLLGNTKETSVEHYISPDVEQGKAGLRLLESAYEAEVAKLAQE